MEFKDLGGGLMVRTPTGMNRIKENMQIKHLPEKVDTIEGDTATLVYENIMLQAKYETEIAEVWYMMAMGGQ